MLTNNTADPTEPSMETVRRDLTEPSMETVMRDLWDALKPERKSPPWGTRGVK